MEDAVDGGKAGHRGAHTTLVAELRKAMAGHPRIAKQGDLARAARVSPATVSNVFTMAKVPSGETLDSLARALGITGQALAGLHQLRDRADQRTRRLNDYLVAAQHAAGDHPYPGVLPGMTPPLTAVYLSQQARAGSGESETDHSLRGPANGSLSAEDVLAGTQTCVVLAGPGGGKSSLLRTYLATEVERWIHGRGEQAVPVLVHASALADRPLTQALSEATSTSLASHGLLDQLPPSFFATAPQPDVCWLVLIDGLDEVTDPATRQRILGTVAAIATGEHAGLYRFVVATRPLPLEELGVLGSGIPHYHLQPFTPSDVEHAALSWFRELQVPDPGSAAQRFVQAVHRTRLDDLARVPLMTSMLCHLYAAAPGQPLPAGRGQIYEAFTALLHQRQYADRPSTASFDTHAGLARYGPGALDRAEYTLDRLPELIARLAAKRHSGSTLPMITLMESQPEAQRPPRVPIESWRAFLHMSLCNSGLVTDRAGELVFLHQTLLEYLAARHATRDARAAARALRQVFHRPARYWRFSDAPGLTRRWWGSRYWKPPAEGASDVGFLIDASQEHNLAACTRYLARLASSRAGLRGCEFIAEQAQLGTNLPRHVVASAGDLCAALACDPAFRYNSPLSVRDPDAYMSLSFISPQILRHSRVMVAEVLVKLGDSRAADVLFSLAIDPSLDDLSQVEAARALSDLDDLRAADLLHSLATTSVRGWSRVRAARSLCALSDPRTADLLHSLALASATSLNGEDRLNAAKALCDLDGHRGADLLYSLASDPAQVDRVGAARKLTELSDPRGIDLAYALATDPTFRFRVSPARLLAELGDPRGADLLHSLATDLTLKIGERLDAARALARLHGPRAHDLLYSLASHPAVTESILDMGAGMSAAKELAKAGDLRGTDLLYSLATKPMSRDRVQAARVLADLGDPRGGDVLCSLAMEATVDESHRAYASQVLIELGDPRADDVLYSQATDPAFKSANKAAQLLAERRDPRAAGVPLRTTWVRRLVRNACRSRSWRR
ncbi:helix-turn-helix domain-containing protein [Streptomyces phaeoluteigriseus]|uniref:helix-turn-helix domain-containing protein n=1 Tax=Streptomyces phaeoluteigriseus TaxID=114686 RepID=UPI0036C7AA55